MTLRQLAIIYALLPFPFTILRFAVAVPVTDDADGEAVANCLAFGSASTLGTATTGLDWETCPDKLCSA
jgi:hypothetical protein